MSTSTISKREAEAGPTTTGTIVGLIIVFLLAVATRYAKSAVYGVTLPGNIPGTVLEYPIWAALFGLIANGVLKGAGVHHRVKSGFRTELFLKIGLVLLGLKIDFALLVTSAFGAVIQGLIMVTSVFLFSWWLGGRFGLPSTLRAVMSTAVSICGVSAAIAAAGSVLAKKEEITYITALVIVTALPLMVIAPLLAQAMGLSQAVAGAWFGGNVDTTAAVVGAGTIYGPRAQEIAAIVKNTQNALIGVVAFVLAYYFSTVVEGGERPSASMLWKRFPKFVLGFILASLIFTFGFIPKGSDAFKAIGGMRDWAFALAFVCMGLELSASDMRKMGWSPVIVYLVVTVFNTLLALAISWIIFGWLLPI
jgi:uncharacterized integral membrane protein (TIGR00698 family)